MTARRRFCQECAPVSKPVPEMAIIWLIEATKTLSISRSATVVPGMAGAIQTTIYKQCWTVMVNGSSCIRMVRHIETLRAGVKEEYEKMTYRFFPSPDKYPGREICDNGSSQ